VIFDENANLNSPDDEMFQSDREIGRSELSTFESRRSNLYVNPGVANLSLCNASEHHSPLTYDSRIHLGFVASWKSNIREPLSIQGTLWLISIRKVTIFQIGQGLGPRNEYLGSLPVHFNHEWCFAPVTGLVSPRIFRTSHLSTSRTTLRGASAERGICNWS
jgi:hypothetical protein